MAVYEYYTDGAATMKKKNGEYVREAGGWAFAQVKDNNPIFSMSGQEKETTNQVMELRAIYEALEHYHKHYYSPNIADTVKIYSDSAYSINIYTQWAKGWEAKGWTRGKGQKIENLEIIRKTWELLQILNSGFNSISFVKVTGHSGNSCNEYVDKLAVAAKQGKPLNRKDGVIAKFTVYDSLGEAPKGQKYYLTTDGPMTIEFFGADLEGLNSFLIEK